MLEAGVGGGQKMKAAGGKKALCVNHEVGNVALDRRCRFQKRIWWISRYFRYIK